MTMLIALAASALPQPGTVGPPSDLLVNTPYASATLEGDFTVYPDETVAQAEARIRKDTCNAWTKFWVGQGLVAADLALTCAILAKGGKELNPIYGKNASCGKIVGIRAGISALQYVLARKAINRDPRQAAKRMNITVAIQGVPVIWNAVQLAR